MCESIKKGTLVEMLEDSAEGGLWKKGSIGRTTVDFPTLQNNVCVADFNIPENPFRGASMYNTVRAGKIWAIADDTETKPKYKIYTPKKENYMKENMTRAEALAEIKRLNAYINVLPEHNHPAEYARGQVYKHSDGDLYVLSTRSIPGVASDFRLVCLQSSVRDCVGNVWTSSSIFDDRETDFTYVGMLYDVGSFDA